MYHVISNMRNYKLLNKSIKMLKFTDTSSDLYFLRFLQIPVIPRFLTGLVEIRKVIDTIPNRVGPLRECGVICAATALHTYSLHLIFHMLIIMANCFKVVSNLPVVVFIISSLFYWLSCV